MKKIIVFMILIGVLCLVLSLASFEITKAEARCITPDCIYGG